MHNVLENIFLITILMVFYAYFGYPISLYFLCLFISKDIKKSEIFPKISIIIAAHNEEKLIVDKIENTLAVLYPKDCIEVIIISDGSNDRTNHIVSSYNEKGIKLIAISERKGKENAQKEGVKISSGEILVFTDVATTLDPMAIKQIVSNFADPRIGCVSGEDKVIDRDGKIGGEGYYVRYEMWLRKLESNVNTLVGLSGSFFAARKSVCQDFSSYFDSDFRTLLNSVKCGMRGVSDPKAIGYYREISDQRLEFERKVRTVLRGITVFFNNLEYLNIFRYRLFSYQYFCHKFLRWLVPLFIVIGCISIILLSFSSWFYLAILLVISIAILFLLLERVGIISDFPEFMKIPLFFLKVNISILLAWYRYFRRERIVTWTPTVRS